MASPPTAIKRADSLLVGTSTYGVNLPQSIPHPVYSFVVSTALAAVTLLPSRH